MEEKQIKKGKVATLLEILEKGDFHTVEELSSLSGASVGTVKMQLNYLLPKAGREIEKIEEGEIKKYKLKPKKEV